MAKNTEKSSPRSLPAVATATSNEQLKAIVGAAEKKGVQGLVLGFMNGDVIVTHMHQISPKKASTLVLTLFSQICEGEAAREDAPAGFRQGILALRDEVMSAVNEFNKKKYE